MTLITGVPPLFWPAAAAAALALLLIAWRTRLRWRPAWLLRMALIVAALLAALQPETRSIADAPPVRAVLIVDQSDSLAPEARGLARAQARRWLAEGENRLVILFGRAAIPVSRADFPAIDGSASDLAGALDLSAQFLGREPGRLIIATDGSATDPLAVRRALAHLALNGGEGPQHTILMIPLPANALPADVFMGPVYLPSAMWENSPFTAVLPVFVFTPGDIRLTVTVNGGIVLDETRHLPTGRHLIPIRLRTTVSEVMTIAAEVEAEGDPRPENNTAFAALRVYPAPRVLIVTQDAGVSRAFAQTLAGSGLDADLMVPADLPESLSALSVYQVIVIENILASSLNEGQMRGLKDFVRQLGRGLIFTGGRNAFTLGGYPGTLLEPIMPVRLKPPPREQNSPLTLVLVLDRSASMDGARGTPNHLRPISLAREAALRSVETLNPDDYLGILSYNTSAMWSLPLQPAGAGDVLGIAKAAMAALTPAGGTAIFEALNTAVSALIETPTSETRHIVLLSDGNDDTPLAEYAALAGFAGEQEITISTIALGAEADQALMALLAESGKGRYYPVRQAADLPQILIDESLAARDENIREGETRIVAGEAVHPALSGVTVSSMPSLLGYNALESKAEEGAEDVLLSADFKDPLLSVWQYGLGRVAVWTGDLGGEWGIDMPGWDGWGLLWSNIIRYTLPDPALGPGRVEVTVDSGAVSVAVQIRSGGGAPRNGVPLRFSLTGADGQIRTYEVPQTGPGTYRLGLPRPAEGVYRGVIRYTDEDGFPVELAAPVVVNYPEEWRPVVEPADMAFGEIVDWGRLLPAGETAAEIELAPGRAILRLIAALIVLWPLEIAVRRRRMPWR